MNFVSVQLKDHAISHSRQKALAEIVNGNIMPHLLMQEVSVEK
jgi:hypothetical protein